MKNSLNFLFYYFYYKMLRFSSRKYLDKWQARKINQFMKNVLSKSNYYKPYKTFDQLPILNKKLHMENFNHINTAGMILENVLEVAFSNETKKEFLKTEQKYSFGLSSGTTGNRGIFVTSQYERTRWAACVFAKMLGKITKPQKIALFLRANNDLYESTSSKKICFKFFDLFKNVDELVEEVDRFQPTVLIAPARMLVILAQYKDSNKSVNAFITPSKIISVAEVLEDADKEKISKAFNLPVEQIYQCTEGFLAYTCKAGSMHINEDVVYLEKEWLDRSSNRFVPIITDFVRTTQPIVRYRLDDILVENPNSCACGSVFTRLQKIEGRCDDVLIAEDAHGKQQLLFPDFVRCAMISASEKIEAYQVQQLSPDLLSIKIQPQAADIEKRVTKQINNLYDLKNLVRPRIEFSTYVSTPINQKLRRVSRNFSSQVIL